MKKDEMWFKCFPEKWLNAVAQMTSDEMLVYWIVCFRIYDADGPCPDSLKALSMRARMNRRRVSNALDSLFKASKLVRIADGITNPFATEILAERHERIRAATGAALSRWEKHKQNQQKADANAMRPQCDRNAQPSLSSPPDSQISKDSVKGSDSQQSLFLVESQNLTESHSGNKIARAKKQKHRLPSDWRASAKGIAYAEKHGYSQQEIAEMETNFKENHEGKGTLWLNWDMAWQTWVRRETHYHPPGKGNHNGQGRSRPLQDDSRSLVKAAQRLAEKARRGEFEFTPRPGSAEYYKRMADEAGGNIVPVLPPRGSS